MENKNWQSDPPTTKQTEAIMNMQIALGADVNIPATKGECSILIGKLKQAIQNNLNATGCINSNYEPWGGLDDFEFLNDIY